jgi:hypothetical protein
MKTEKVKSRGAHFVSILQPGAYWGHAQCFKNFADGPINQYGSFFKLKKKL